MKRCNGGGSAGSAQIPAAAAAVCAHWVTRQCLIETQSKESKKALVVFKCKKCGLQRIQPQEPLHDSEKFSKFSPYLLYGDEDTFFLTQFIVKIFI